MNQKTLLLVLYILWMPTFISPMLTESSEERPKNFERSLSKLEKEVRSCGVKKITARLSVMDQDERDYILQGEASKLDLQRKTVQQMAQDRVDSAQREQSKIITKDRVKGALYAVFVGGITFYVTANEIFTEDCSNKNDSWYERVYRNLPQLCVAAVPFWESGKELRKVLINYYAHRKYERAVAVQQGLLLHTPPSSPAGTLTRLSETRHAADRRSLQNTLNIQQNQETIAMLEEQLNLQKQQVEVLTTALTTAKETDKIQRRQTKKRKSIIAEIEVEESSTYSDSPPTITSKSNSGSSDDEGSSEESPSVTDDLS